MTDAKIGSPATPIVAGFIHGEDMLPEKCYVGQKVCQSPVFYAEGTVLALFFTLNGDNGLVPTARIQWSDEDEPMDEDVSTLTEYGEDSLTAK